MSDNDEQIMLWAFTIFLLAMALGIVVAYIIIAVHWIESGQPLERLFTIQ